MVLNRWSPLGELASLHSAMDRLFSDFFGTPLLGDGGFSSTSWYLPVDIVDRGSAYEIQAAVPGFTPDEVEVTYSDGTLSISAQHKQEQASKDASYLRRELTPGNYSRTLRLPGAIKQDEIKASFENGILTIDVPKVSAPQPLKIPITGKAQKQLVGAVSKK